MVLKSKETIGNNQSELVFTIDKAVFDKAVMDAYKKNVKRMNIPGFRKGKAPKAIVEKMYGKGVFYEDALNAILPDEYEAALKESGLDVVSRPEFDVDDIGDEGVTVKAKASRPSASSLLSPTRTCRRNLSAYSSAIPAPLRSPTGLPPSTI